MSSESSRHDELKKKLRAKIKGKRGGNFITETSASLKKDPQTALMSLGVDDMDVLMNAKKIVQNPLSYLHEQVEKESRASKKEEDDEGLPPEML